MNDILIDLWDLFFSGFLCHILHPPTSMERGKVNDVFNALDRKVRKDASQKSHMMTFSRLEGLPSDRAKPEGLGLPNWVFKQVSV